MTDKKDDQKDSLTSAVDEGIKQKNYCDKLEKDAPNTSVENTSVENLFKLLVYNIRLAIPKLKRWRALKNFNRVLKKKNENIDKLLNASNDIEPKKKLEKRKAFIDKLKEGVHYWTQPIEDTRSNIRLNTAELGPQLKLFEELSGIGNLGLDITGALEVLSDADNDHEDIMTEIRETHSRFCKVAKKIAKNLKVKEFDLKSDNIMNKVSRDEFKKALADKLVRALDGRKQTIEQHEKDLRDRTKSDVIEGLFTAIGELKKRSGIEITYVVFGATALVGAADAYPKYKVLGISSLLNNP